MSIDWAYLVHSIDFRLESVNHHIANYITQILERCYAVISTSSGFVMDK